MCRFIFWFSKTRSPHFGYQLSSLSMRGAELGQAVRHMPLNIVEFDAVAED
jgi:hypothetical protein